jgi:hypothetical protein
MRHTETANEPPLKAVVLRLGFRDDIGPQWSPSIYLCVRVLSVVL